MPSLGFCVRLPLETATAAAVVTTTATATASLPSLMKLETFQGMSLWLLQIPVMPGVVHQALPTPESSPLSPFKSLYKNEPQPRILNSIKQTNMWVEKDM